MPKLPSAAAKAVEKSEAVHGGGGSFEPLAPGKYLAQLREVTVRDQTDKHGHTQWSAEFENLHSLEDHEKAPGRQWLNLTVPLGKKMPASYTNGPEKWEKYQAMVMGRLKAFFESFGYTTDSDTDEMIGEWAVITVSQRTIQDGPKTGEITNRVDGIESLADAGDIELEDFGIDGFEDEEAF